MAVRVYWIESFSSGARLGIMARPRGDEWLDSEMLNLKKQGVALLVSLLENSEIGELGLGDEAAACERAGIEFINFSIPDRGLPGSEVKIADLIKTLAEKIDIGGSVAIHCRMGIGRSSIVAGAVLLQKGFTADKALRQITDARGLKVPDTNEQVEWLRKRGRR